jgi:hypothetical protein
VSAIELVGGPEDGRVITLAYRTDILALPQFTRAGLKELIYQQRLDDARHFDYVGETDA